MRCDNWHNDWQVTCQNTRMESSYIQEISTEQFLDKIVVPQADALVKVSTTWNGAGQMLRLTLFELSQKYSGKLSFFYINQDLNTEIINLYRVDTVPTILFFKKGTLVDKLPGLNQRNTIEEKINQIVNS